MGNMAQAKIDRLALRRTLRNAAKNAVTVKPSIWQRFLDWVR
ncbi:MAG: hypothetical protein ACKO0Z_11900 [Betaproteobacteria bacterium]